MWYGRESIGVEDLGTADDHVRRFSVKNENNGRKPQDLLSSTQIFLISTQ